MNIYDFSVDKINGEFTSLREYEGKVILIVNSATRCGFTPQYDELEDLYEAYVEDGFVILEFPSNEFGQQAPESNQEIAAFCDAKFGIHFPHFAKVLVNGEYANPLFKYLQNEQGFRGFDEEHPLTAMLESKFERENPNYKNEPDIKWNFTKFLVDRSGKGVARFEPTADFDKIKKEIEKLLDMQGLNRIEAYDISNISGFQTVGSMIVYEKGKPCRSDYRKFRLKTIQGPDDYASMHEVLTRRFLHGIEEKKELQERVKSVIERVNNAAVQAGRDPSEITLVAATKMNDAERVQAAIEAGIRVCGENRVQELQEKYEQNAYDGADLQFIGTLQTNKVKYLIGKVSLIQSVGSVHLGEAIAKEAEKRGVCQDILLEVNIGREAAKSGLPPEELHDAIVKLSAKKSLHIRGLMAIPPVADEKTKNSNYFTEMRQVFIDILTKKYDNVDMDYLSMGMTNDFETAIACGANMVRVGTAIFGKRPYQIVSP